MTERPPHEPLIALGRREPAGRSEQLRGGVERAAQHRLPRSLLDRARRRLVRLRRALREMASTLLFIGDDRGQPPMELPAPRVGRGAVHRGRQQRVREPDATLLGDEDARLLAPR